MGHRFNPKHVERLLNEERQKLLPPETILERLGVEPSHVVADIGCGPGYFSLPLAQMSRAVYGVDVSAEMLDLLARRAAEAGVCNVESIQAAAEHIPLPDASVDRMLCAFVLHEVDDLKQTLAEFNRLLKPEGRLMVIEWEKKSMDMGPPVSERIDMAELTSLVEDAGFHTKCWQPNPYHYIILARR
ncbi:class I SAM-dependent methyltransferase [Alicyclobacillus macrosporangiidus]|uniref:Methyltransferase domain-containing protein n=1 Tax=Alicyclobacillus macrosporangiidus TaxID=392015 RepID=A0A1I7L7L6_9BACL|nr:methyltransferase domain-containing protein [Alicyclobacillus macrosporangiidus]SFV05782.1 Methyltransferase domain-containing protein [Alicyclobacillus macrosporangiidus]